MKKLVFLGSTITALLTPIQTLAQTVNISPPPQGFKTLGNFISSVLILALSVGGLIVLIMLIWGAFEWIASGGDKENVGKARNRIINALIGLAVLAIAFALANLFAKFTGFDIGNLTIPTPNPNAPGL